VIEAGDIDTTRDFTDVRDVVGAYAAMLGRGKPGATYLIGTGQERRVRDLLRAMCESCGIAPEIRQDPARMRPSEQRRMAADATRLRQDTGWSPSISMESTINDILDEARNCI
jgi:dTDP-D-glucose 4,6-dehydratase